MRKKSVLKASVGKTQHAGGGLRTPEDEVVRMAKTRMIVLGQKNAGIIVSFMPIYTNGEHVIEAYGGNQSDEERKTIQEWVDKTTPVGCDPLSEYAVSNCKYYDTSGVNSMSNVFFLRCCTVPPKDFVRYGDAFDYDFVSVSPLEVHLVATGESLYILYKEKQGEFEAGYYKVHVLAKIGSTEEELVTDLEEDEEDEVDADEGAKKNKGEKEVKDEKLPAKRKAASSSSSSSKK